MLDKVKKNFYPKGRGIEDSALKDIKKLISDLPLKRDLLIEYFHLIQDKFGEIRKKHLAALSEILKIPFAESYEVATFYAHFDVIEDDEPSIQDITIRVCDSLIRGYGGAFVRSNARKRTGSVSWNLLAGPQDVGKLSQSQRRCIRDCFAGH